MPAPPPPPLLHRSHAWAIAPIPLCVPTPPSLFPQRNRARQPGGRAHGHGQVQCRWPWLLGWGAVTHRPTRLLAKTSVPQLIRILTPGTAVYTEGAVTDESEGGPSTRGRMEGTQSWDTGNELQEKKRSWAGCLGGQTKMAQHVLLPTVWPLLGRHPTLWLFLGAVGCVSPRSRRLCMRLSAELTFQTLRLEAAELGGGGRAWSVEPWPQMATRAGSQLQASPPRWQPLQSLIRPATHTGLSPNSSVAATRGHPGLTTLGPFSGLLEGLPDPLPLLSLEQVASCSKPSATWSQSSSANVNFKCLCDIS